MADFELIKFKGVTDPASALANRRKQIELFVRPHKEQAVRYDPLPDLVTAINVALSLGRPLLLTGDPGCGKTQAAYWIARELGLTDSFQEFHVKSDSRARDLLYRFDAVSWFRAVQLEQEAGTGATVSKESYLEAGPLGFAFGWRPQKPAPAAQAEASEVANTPAEVANTPTALAPVVVLIDEIDKAPRDFPNDLLLELDQMRFKVAETGEDVVCPPESRPIIVITSNAERRLPDPFLRRCILHKIDIAAVVPNILRARLGTLQPSHEALLEAGAEFWNSLKDLPRKPSIDEFWRWLALMTQSGGQAPADIAAALKERGDKLCALPAIGTLFATAADLKRIAETRA